MKLIKGKLSSFLRMVFLIISIILFVYLCFDVINFFNMKKLLRQAYSQQVLTEDLRNTISLLQQAELDLIKMKSGSVPNDANSLISLIEAVNYRLADLVNSSAVSQDNKDLLKKTITNLISLNEVFNQKDITLLDQKEFNDLKERLFLNIRFLEKVNKTYSYQNNLVYNDIQSKIDENALLRSLLVLLFFSLIFIFVLITRVFNHKVTKLSDIILNPGEYMKNKTNYDEHDEFRKMIDSYLKMYSEQNHSLSEIHFLQDYLNNMIDSMPSIVVAVDQSFKVNQWNQSARTYTGICSEKAKGWLLEDLMPYFKTIKHELSFILKNNTVYHLNKQRILDDQNKVFNITAYPIVNISSTGIVLRIDDITDIERKEIQLRQAQKMDSVGTLAGGLAHDFNNILCGIVGCLSILELKLIDPKKDISREELINSIELMSQSCHNASEMVKQLLTLARKKEMEFVSYDLNQSIKRVQTVCRNSFDKSINIFVDYGFEESIIHGDMSQIEQVLMNLLINAGHAMTVMRPEGEPQGGTITLSTGKFSPDSQYIHAHPTAKMTDYWKLSVADTGVGIRPENKDKIFDPFFTTKDSNVGTGLGLSMAYNIINQHDGFIEVHSEPGVGTTFEIYLPVHQKEENNGKKILFEDIRHGKGNILLIDDDDVLRNVTEIILKECGYKVTAKNCPLEALSHFLEEKDTVDLVIVDLVMPKIGGHELIEKVKRIKPHQKIILTSGFHQDKRITKALELGADLFIPKPFTMNHLSNEVYKVLSGADS